MFNKYLIYFNYLDYVKRVIKQTTWLSVGCGTFLIGLALGRRWPSYWWCYSAVGLVTCLAGYRTKARLWIIGIALICLGIGIYKGATYKQKLVVYESLFGKQVVIETTATSDATYSVSQNLGFDAGSLQLVTPEHKPLPGIMKFEIRGLPAVYRNDRLRIGGKIYPAGGSRQASMKFAPAQLISHHVNWLESIRLKFVAAMQTTLPEPLASFGLGILVGQRTTLPKDVNDQLSTVGLTHIIAVSGYNLTIIVQFVSKKLGKRSKFQIMVLSTSMICIFILITGFSASIVRAGIVSMLSLGAWYYGRSIKPILLLLLSAVITAGWNPVYLWSDIGWWLSFLAFFGVLVIGPLITAFFWRDSEPRGLMPLMIESASAQIMAAPFIMYIFKQASLISLVSNVIIVPLVPLSMLLLMIAGVGGMILPQIAAWLAWPARTLTSYMLEVVQLLSKVPYARVTWPISVIQLGAIYCLIVACCWFMWFKTKPNYAKITDEAEVV